MSNLQPATTTAPTKATPLNEAVSSVATTVSRGDAPTNAQITGVLGEASHLLDEKKREAPLNPTGQKIADQMKDVLANTTALIRDKNPNDTLQSLAKDAKAATKDAELSATMKEAKNLGEKVGQQAADATAKEGGKVKGEAGSLKEQTKAAASAAADAAMEAAREIVSSAEFRQLLVDFLNILQQGLRTGAEQLNDTADELQGSLQEAKEKVASGESAEGLAKDAQRKAEEKGEEIKQKAEQKGEELKAKADETLQSAKEKAVEFGERARVEANEVLAGRKDPLELLPLSEQQRNEMRDRFDALLKRIGAVESYRKALDAILRLGQQYRRILEDAAPKAQAIAENAQNELADNVHVKRVWAEAKVLVERWTNGRSLDVFVQRTKELYESISSDPELQQWWCDIQDYARFAIENPDAAITEERKERFNQLVERGRKLYSGKIAYNKALRGMLHEGRILLNVMRNDRTVANLTESLRSLAQTLFLDTRGNPAVKPEELRQFKILITSLLMEEFKYIPLSRISGSLPDYDFALSNMSIYGFDLLPEHILFKAETRGDINTKDVTAATRSNFRIAFTNMHLAMKNVMFWFKKKHGLVRMEDAGIADIAIAGKGASLTIEFEYDSSSDRSMLMRGVRCDIDKLNVHIVDSRYDWLLNMVQPFVSSDIKHNVERSVAARVAETVDKVFVNLRANLPDTPAALKGVGDRITSEIKDLQMTKNNLDVQPSTQS